MLNLGVDPSRIIYANPCKQASFVRFSRQQRVAKMTFDNAEELHKIKRLYPDAELVLRILTDDSKSLCQLGLKFGAPMHSVESLLQTAKDLELNVIGVSFHVGSGCLDEHAFSDAVLRARKAFDIGEALGFKFSLLDVGGGFPGADVQDGITFEKVAAVLRPAVDALFPPEVRVIAEPGRYYVASAFTICTSVVGRRTVMPDPEDNEGSEPKYMCKLHPPFSAAWNEMLTYSFGFFIDYVNDGMYGSFNCILFDHQVVYPKGMYFDQSLFGMAFIDSIFERSLVQERIIFVWRESRRGSFRLQCLGPYMWFHWLFGKGNPIASVGRRRLALLGKHGRVYYLCRLAIQWLQTLRSSLYEHLLLAFFSFLIYRFNNKHVHFATREWLDMGRGLLRDKINSAQTIHVTRASDIFHASVLL